MEKEESEKVKNDEEKKEKVYPRVIEGLIYDSMSPFRDCVLSMTVNGQT